MLNWLMGVYYSALCSSFFIKSAPLWTWRGQKGSLFVMDSEIKGQIPNLFLRRHSSLSTIFDQNIHLTAWYFHPRPFFWPTRKKGKQISQLCCNFSITCYHSNFHPKNISFPITPWEENSKSGRKWQIFPHLFVVVKCQKSLACWRTRAWHEKSIAGDIELKLSNLNIDVKARCCYGDLCVYLTHIHYRP
jgi:hypothetical protein